MNASVYLLHVVVKFEFLPQKSESLVYQAVEEYGMKRPAIFGASPHRLKSLSRFCIQFDVARLC